MLQVNTQAQDPSSRIKLKAQAQGTRSSLMLKAQAQGLRLTTQSQSPMVKIEDQG